MPQLDATTFIPQLFWLAVSFLVLYLLMRLVALPRVGAAIALRRSRLDEDLARAAEIRTQAQAVLSEYEAGLAAARAGNQNFSSRSPTLTFYVCARLLFGVKWGRSMRLESR